MEKNVSWTRRECWFIRKEQQEEKVDGRGRNFKEIRLVEKEGTAGRKGWWIRKEQQEGKVGG